MLTGTCVIVTAQSQPAPPQPPQAAACAITGTVTAGLSKLPGVSITVASMAGGDPMLTSTDAGGAFRVHVPAAGTYDVLAEFPAFASTAKTVTLGSDCQATVELALTLRSRAPVTATPKPPAATDAAAGAAPGAAAAPPSGTAQSPQRGGGPAFQRVAPVAGARGGQRGQAAGPAGGGTEDAATVAQHLNLPAGFNPEAVGETVTTFGSNTQTNTAMLFGGRGAAGMGGGGFGGEAGGMAGMAQLGGGFSAGAFGLAGVTPGGGGAGGGGLGGMAGMAGVVGMAGAIPGLGNLQGQRYSGQGAYTLGGSMLDANSYPINGQARVNPDYLNQRYTFAVGGPAKIPGLFNLGTRSSVFLNYAGSHGSNVSDTYARVPSLAFRNGDFSSLATPLVDPSTGQPFPDNRIPATRVSPTAFALLGYYPLPNQVGSTQNYHYPGTAATSSDDINVRFARTFGTIQLARIISAMGRGGGPGAALGAINNVVNLNVGLHYSRADIEQLTAFPTLTGRTHRSSWDVPVNVTFGKWGLLNTVSLQFNRSKSETLNQFSGVTDVAGAAGIVGVSKDPFDWGVPTLNFSTLSSLRDVNPSESLNQSLTVTAWSLKLLNRQTLRWGGDVKTLVQDVRSNANARGSYVFTGFYTGGAAGTASTGYDFADFLLGVSPQATIQIGPGTERYRAHGYSLYVQDDWRVSGRVTLNLGARYEYQSPYTETTDRLVTLDAPPDFSTAVSVQAGQDGPYHGLFPASIAHPDRNNLAPRLGAAWRANQKTTVRGGYGINYASVPYSTIVQKLAAQPPFATTNTAIGTATVPLPIATVFATPVPPSTTTNTFGVDPNYRIGFVQIWNIDVQRDLVRAWTAGASYTGTKGSSLDVLRAPNRGPSGLRIPDVQSFIWESSGATSIMHALSVRVRKRLTMGVSGGATYTWSHAYDDASSVGGGSGVVAQNDRNLAAEWGRSSFDQRHRLTGDFSWELPFGTNRKWMSGDGWADTIVGGWIVNGTVSYSSGSPFTVRVTGASSDIVNGVNGTLRADYNGQDTELSSPTVSTFFNTAAFSIPASGTFGNSPRNLVTGPPSTVVNMALSKNFKLRGPRSLALRVQANNVLNMPQWGSIDTVVNSPTFGSVVSTRPMRSVQIIARVGF